MRRPGVAIQISTPKHHKQKDYALKNTYTYYTAWSELIRNYRVIKKYQYKENAIKGFNECRF